MRKFFRGDREEKMMYSATCDKCGRKCEVPFKPRGDKPIYCSDCFEEVEERGGGRNDRFRGRDRDRGRDWDREEKRMFPAVCDDCGKRCEVPFKPSSDKPIYCSDCFEKRGNSHSGGDSKPRGNMNLDEINAKLDKILAILDPKSVETKIEEINKELKTTKKAATKKKTTKKKE